MTYLWAGMILIGVVYGTVTGDLSAVTEAAVTSSKEAVALCIAMAGVIALWTGIMKIAEMTGLVERLAKGFRPLFHFLFPRVPVESEAANYISLNFLSNFLGLGWAATPAGLKAMEELKKLEKEQENDIEGAEEKKKGKERNQKEMDQGEEMNDGKNHVLLKKRTASNEMCTFLIINVSSLQLIPVNIIAYRSQYGSVNPAAIVGPGLLATLCSTLTAVVFCKVMD